MSKNRYTAEVHNSKGEYVGYYNPRSNRIVDTRKGGLEDSRKMAGAKGARRNPAMSAQAQNFRKTGR